MANLVTKSKTKIALIVFVVLFLISILSIFFFKLNLGVEFMDATVVSVQLDHEDTMNNYGPEVSKYYPVSKIEKEGTSNFYFYIQNISKEQANVLVDNIKTDNNGVITAEVFDYKTARERALISRAEIIIAFAIIAFCIYFLMNFKNKRFTTLEVLLLLTTELAVVLVNSVILMGLVSILGKIGIVMDTNFWSIFLLSFGLLMIFRIYELIKVRMVLRTLDVEDTDDAYSKVRSIYWPEFVFIACFLAVVTLLPLTVLGSSILVSSIMVLFSIVMALASVFYLKPFLQFEILSLASSKTLLKVKFLSKKW